MFTRVVELTSKPGKSRDLSNTINDKVVPILKKQAGFVDEIVLVSDAERDQVLALSFWNKREDAERYQREQYDNVRETLQPLLEADPVVRTFEVHTSTGHTRSPQAKRPDTGPKKASLNRLPFPLKTDANPRPTSPEKPVT